MHSRIRPPSLVYLAGMNYEDAQEHETFRLQEGHGVSGREPSIHHVATYQPRPISDERNRALIREAIRQAPRDAAGRALRPAG